MRGVYVYAYTVATKIATLIPFPDYCLTPEAPRPVPGFPLPEILAKPIPEELVLDHAHVE